MIKLPEWLQYIEEQIGFILPAVQHHWLEKAIVDTAKINDLTVNELWVNIKTDEKLRQALFDAILILESRFFRHQPSIDYICRLALAKQQDEKTDNNFRVWSVGCSEGQEAWSIAMTLSEQGLDDYKILGTDMSTRALNSAKSATYDRRTKQHIPVKYHHLIEEINTEKQQALRLCDEVQQKVSFALHNVFSSTKVWNEHAQLLTAKDVIICQNMLIYFRQFDQRDILAKFVEKCKIGGHIILAPGEAFAWKHPQMIRVESDQINAWKKVC